MCAALVCSLGTLAPSDRPTKGLSVGAVWNTPMTCVYAVLMEMATTVCTASQHIYCYTETFAKLWLDCMVDTSAYHASRQKCASAR